MQTEVLYRPSDSLCRVLLDAGEQIRAEGGAMVSMAGVDLQTGATGGFLKSFGRSMLGGESFFQNIYTAREAGAELTLAPQLPGDIMVRPLSGDAMIVQSGSYLASELGIEVDARWGGARSFFGGEGLFMLHCAGTGTLVVSSFGAIHKVPLAPGQGYTVDTGHLVAFPAGMSYRPRRAGSLKSSLFGGEGWVVDLVGPGDVYLQTRSPGALVSWVAANMPARG